MSASRTYSSPLRAELQQQVKHRLLEKILEVLADPSAPELNAAEIAKRADVSTRTVYRYFQTKEALIDAALDEMRRKLGHHSLPVHVDELSSNIAELFASFDRNRELVNAMRWSNAGRETRVRRKQGQRNAIAALLAGHVKHIADEGDARAVAAIFNCLASSEVWIEMTQTWEVTTEQATRAVQWAVETLLTQLETEGKWTKGNSKRPGRDAGKSKTRT